MNLYYYKIKMIIDDKFEKEDGYTVGNSFSEAMDRLLEYYGEDEVEEVKLSYVADRPVLILPTQGAITEKGLIKAIAENNCF